MNPLLKTPPGSWSKCSSSMARSMREPILVTLETSSREISFFSRALRNLSPNSLGLAHPRRRSVRLRSQQRMERQQGKEGAPNGGHSTIIYRSNGQTLPVAVPESHFDAFPRVLLTAGPPLSGTAYPPPET